MENQFLNRLLSSVVIIMIFISCKDENPNSPIPKNSSTALKTKGKVIKDDSLQLKDTLIVKSDTIKPSIGMLEQDTTKKEAIKVKPKRKKKHKAFPKFKFETLVHDFGEIDEGDTINYSFKFVNVGKAVLDIMSANATCGCTHPSYPFMGILPGEEGKIDVRYISVGKSGQQEATITIKSNAATPNLKLQLKGKVKAKKEEKKDRKD